MRRTILTLAILSTALTAAPTRAEPVVLKPNGPWNIDFGDNKCRLAGFFGEGDDRHVLLLEQYWPGPQFGLTIAGPAVRNFRNQKQVQVQFADGMEPLSATPFTGSLGDAGKAVIFSSLSLEKRETGPADESGSGGLRQLDPALGKQVRFIALNQNGRSVRLETGRLDETFAVLNKCTAGLLSAWGLDPDQHLSAQSRPRWLNQEVLVRRIIERYPASAAAIGEQGIMRMRVIVSPAGTVEDCAIIKATTTKKLESPACEVMQDARFEPARDVAGQPFRSLFVTSITYKIR